MDKIEKIREEIERLKGICMAQIKANPGQTLPFVMEMTGYDKLLSFLNTLSEEPSKSLQKEIETWIPAHINVKTDETLPINPTELAEICKEWGKCIARHFAEWQKSQMLKDAVEGFVCYGSKGAYIETDFLGEYDTDVYGNPGDQVRVVVLKAEEEQR